MQSRARDFRSYGSEYLNTQFGWLPFVRDVKDFGRAVKDSDRILKQFRQDSGRTIRRRADLKGESTSTVEDMGMFYAYPVNGDFWQTIQRPTTARTTVQRKRWVVACYSYYLDPGDSILGKAARFSQEADKLLGISLTPETLWELAPWSWAVDWFTNTGNAISVLSDYINYGPVLRYAYAMETTTSQKVLNAQGFVDRRGTIHNYNYTYNRQVKVREPASPFTFRNVNGSLSSQQLAIVAALGISNAPTTIRP